MQRGDASTGLRPAILFASRRLVGGRRKLLGPEEVERVETFRVALGVSCSCFLNARAGNSAAVFDATAAARARPSCRARVDARFRESRSPHGDVVPGSTRTKVTRALTKAICGNLGSRREPAISRFVPGVVRTAGR